MKKYININVCEAAKRRISRALDLCESAYVSFSGGKDSTVLLHMVMDEAIKREIKIGVLIIDLEAQYKDTIKNINNCLDLYEQYIEVHWFCGELLLRNAVSNFEPKWTCWDSDKENIWIRDKPARSSDLNQYDFYIPKMEFEEVMVLFGEWYTKKHGKTAAFIGIRSDESLHRYKAITAKKKNLTLHGYKWSTRISKDLYNIYPLYDWKTEDIWIWVGKNKDRPFNEVYSKMTMAGVPLSNQRLCQPYGDDQRRGLWLYHILEPDTWSKLINRVSGVNSGASHVQENGNISGYRSITKPQGMTWQEYTNILLATLPKKTRENYTNRFKKFIAGWKKRGYDTIPDQSPHKLEVKCWAPSWRRMCRCILRNDYYCKGLGQTQPLSEAYKKFKEIKTKRKLSNQLNQERSVSQTIELF